MQGATAATRQQLPIVVSSVVFTVDPHTLFAHRIMANTKTAEAAIEATRVVRPIGCRAVAMSPVLIVGSSDGGTVVVVVGGGVPLVSPETAIVIGLRTYHCGGKQR